MNKRREKYTLKLSKCLSMNSKSSKWWFSARSVRGSTTSHVVVSKSYKVLLLMGVRVERKQFEDNLWGWVSRFFLCLRCYDHAYVVFDFPFPILPKLKINGNRCSYASCLFMVMFLGRDWEIFSKLFGNFVFLNSNPKKF